MPNINVTARAGDPAETDADTRVVCLFEGDDAGDAAVKSLVDAGEAKPALGKVAVTHEDGGRRLIVVGPGQARRAGRREGPRGRRRAAGRAGELGTKALSWAAPADVAGAVVEGTLIKLYEFDRFKTKKDDDDDGSDATTAWRPWRSPARTWTRPWWPPPRWPPRAVNRARDLQNLPGNVATPEYLAGRAREIGEQFGDLEVEIFGRDAITEMGMGAFACVAQGTYAEPQMIVLRYTGGTNGPHLGFVGKAVTFDTGGISLKPGAKMSEMKFDMSGGAAVLEAVAAIAELGLPITLTAVLGATENMPSGHSVKPGDIVTAMNGKTIEINNTDAEGRLVLADILHYTIEQGAERVVNLATLTGRDPGGAGLDPLRPVLQRRRLVRPGRRRLQRHRRAGLAAAAAPRDGQDGQGQVRRPGQRPGRAQGRLDHRRRVPEGVRGRHALGAHGHRGHRLGAEPPLRGQRRVGLRRAHADRAGARLRCVTPR